MTLIARFQHLHFQTYLRKEREEVNKKLKKKNFPDTEYADYKFIEILGQGGYGMVVLAENIQTQEKWAIKIVTKRSLVKKERLGHLISEIRILSSINFKFLVSLKCYFTNKCNVFLVLPYINGGHFFELLRTSERFEENVAMFFAGQVVLAFEYLHYMGIVYRDLKPENIILDKQGYLKIIDFGFASAIGHNYTYSFCGTPEYLAPEILLNKGHNLSPDWWTFGILLYEMCNGKPPFTAFSDIVLYKKILNCDIRWPSHFSNHLKSLIQGLLQVDKTRRLGCMKHRVEDIKFHKWFSPLNWNALLQKKIAPPIIFNNPPKSKRLFNDFMKSKLETCHNIPSDMIGNIDYSV